MGVRNDTREIWLVAHPLYQYKEDVKDLARRNNLKIYDKNLDVEFDEKKLAKKPPKLTLKKEYEKQADKPAE